MSRDKLNITEIVKDQTATFLYYIDGNLWYATDNGFKFPIPIDDTKGACFNKEHKAITLMRWIRKHIDTIETGDVGC